MKEEEEEQGILFNLEKDNEKTKMKVGREEELIIYMKVKKKSNEGAKMKQWKRKITDGVEKKGNEGRKIDTRKEEM